MTANDMAADSPSSSRPRVLAIGGLDPCGGAGVTLDARIAEARGGFALTVPACLTVQSRRGVVAVEPVGAKLLAEMIGAAVADGAVGAVKLGLLASDATAANVMQELERNGLLEVPLVVDPVLGTTAGGWQASEDLVAAYRRTVLPRASIATPNLPELERLSPSGPRALLDDGCRGVLVKGGHADGKAVEDLFYTARDELAFHHPRLDRGPVHGTGCALATALAVGLARGLDAEESCRQSVAAVASCLAATPASRDGMPVPLRVR